MMEKFFVSIITVCFNDAQMLERTMISIKKNKLPYHRYYVIDGASSDDTNKVIAAYNDIVDDYISEPDNGIYDAMNKALRFVCDDSYMIWINAGDELMDWSKIDLSYLPQYDCLFFSVIQKNHPYESGVLVSPYLCYPCNEKNIMPRSILRHQGFLIKKKVFEEYAYDLNVGLQADGYLMSLCQYHKNCHVSKDSVAVFYLDGVSNCKYWSSIVSYYKIVRLFGFNLFKVLYYQRQYLFKSIIKSFMPCFLIVLVRKIMNSHAFIH